MIKQVLLALVSAYATYITLKVLYDFRTSLDMIWGVWRRFTFRMLAENLAVLAAFVIFIALADKLSEHVHFLSWGWMRLLSSKGENLITTPFLHGPNHLLIIAGKVLLFVMLIAALPFLAMKEELMFRQGATTIRSMTLKSIEFGLIHMIMGIPLHAALGLIGAGYFYATRYRNHLFARIDAGIDPHQANVEAIALSTTYHTMYNTIVFMMLGISLLV